MHNDLISRAAAIDALGEKPLAWMESEYAQGLRNQWVWDVNALKALPSAQPERRWVPCSERLPFDAGYYLTTTTYNEVFCDYWNLNEWNRTEQVIAWMPLPEPYRR